MWHEAHAWHQAHRGQKTAEELEGTQEGNPLSLELEADTLGVDQSVHPVGGLVVDKTSCTYMLTLRAVGSLSAALCNTYKMAILYAAEYFQAIGHGKLQLNISRQYLFQHMLRCAPVNSVNGTQQVVSVQLLSLPLRRIENTADFACSNLMWLSLDYDSPETVLTSPSQPALLLLLHILLLRTGLSQGPVGAKFLPPCRC